jgi:hypothetical protein
MTCIYLGPATDRQAVVSCPQIDGRPQRKEPEHDCYHPQRQRVGRRGSRPGRCLPAWPGPWRLPQQQAEAAVLTLCEGCLLRESPPVNSAD